MKNEINQLTDDLDMNEIKNIISSKENEIKTLLMNKIAKLQKEIDDKNKTEENLNNELAKIKEAYNINFKLLEDRDNDLKSYEEKFDSIEKIIIIKDNEIKKLNDIITDINRKLSYEKAQRTQSEQYNKFSISKMTEKHKDEIKFFSIEKENLKKQIEDYKIKNLELSSSIQKIQKNYDNEKKQQDNIIKGINIEKEQMVSIISKQKNEINDLNLQISKLNNENIAQLKEKMTIESKLKGYESKEQENQTNLSLCNQKNKFIQSELEQTKKELNSMAIKNEKFINQINDLQNDIFSLKQLIQMKDFEIEKEKFAAKLQNDKISNLTSTIDQLLKEKSSQDNSNTEILKSYTSQIEKLTQENKELHQEIDTLNNKVKELAAINVKESYSKKEKQIDESVVDFFNNNNNSIPKQSEDFGALQELKNQLNQKELELQRVNAEYEANEAHLLQQIENYKSKEQTSADEANQYRAIVSNLEQKVEELDKLYMEEKNKIKTELNEKINKLKKDNKKIKEERDRLIKLCGELKIEVNRLENNLSLTQNAMENSNMEYPIDEDFNFDNMD